jgi:hypothetical protein
MTEQYIGWALVAGIALGATVVYFVFGHFPRRSDDIGAEERAEEARWISRAIESRGGYAPPALVDEVLELHGRYLEGPALPVRPAEPVPRAPRRTLSAAAATEPEPADDESAVAEDDSELAHEDRRPV